MIDHMSVAFDFVFHVISSIYNWCIQYFEIADLSYLYWSIGLSVVTALLAMIFGKRNDSA